MVRVFWNGPNSLIMACDITTLQTDACTSGFAQAAQNEEQWRALVLQLLYEASGSSDSISTLMTSACSNGFVAAADNEQQFRALELQLLCAVTGG